MEHCRSVFASATVHPASTVPAALVLLHFTHGCFCYNFWFLSILTLVIALVLVFFVISYTLSTYISLSLYKLKLTSLRQYSEREAVSSLLSFLLFFHFLSFSFPFSRLPNTPLRMITQRMFGYTSSSLKRRPAG